MALLSFVIINLFNLQPANAAPTYAGDTLDFIATQAIEVPGTYPPVLRLYGSSGRSGALKPAMLESTDQFKTVRTYTELSGGISLGYTLQVCPPGLTCQGFAAMYIGSDFQIYGCTSLSGTTISGCSKLSPAGLTSNSPDFLTFDLSGVNDRANP